MAPKKNVKTAKATEDIIEKPPKEKKIKKEQSKLKNPTVIKLKIPISCLDKKVQNRSRINGKALPKLTKAEKKQMELDLINEVAKCQLVTGKPIIKVIEEGISKGKAGKKTRKCKKSSDIINSEVAECQLVTGKPVIEVIEEAISEERAGKKTRKRKINSDIINSEESFIHTSVKHVLLKPQKPTLIRKPPDSGLIKESLEKEAPAKPQKRKPVLRRKHPNPVPITDSSKNEALVKKPQKRKSVATNNKAEVEATPKRTSKRQKISNAVVNNRRNRRVSFESINKETISNNLGNTPTHDWQSSCSIIRTFESINVTNPNNNNSRTESPVSNKSVRSFNSQKTSGTSISGSWSWTKDISNSSTTTCVTVCSGDYVRIDGKLPLVQLSDVEEEGKLKELNENVKQGEYSMSDSEDSVDESVSFSCTTPEINSVSQALNLSTSSPSAKSQDLINSRENDDDSNINKIGKALDKLLPKLEKFDLEIMDWIGSANEDTDIEVDVFENQLLKLLKEENDAISHCRNLKNILSSKPVIDQNINNFINENSQKEIVAQTDFSSAIVPEVRTEEHKGGNNSNFVTNNDDILVDEHLNDDDDALSIYADSIADIESSKGNNLCSLSNVNQNIVDEYIPEPINKYSSSQIQSITYNPTKILNPTKDQTIVQNKTKSVCEKQYADSTSINKETEIVKNARELVESNQVANANQNTLVTKRCHDVSIPLLNLKSPRLMVHTYKPITGPRSITMRSVCFFNLISSCKKIACTFPHRQLETKEVSDKLVCLNEEQFVQEYMLIRNWPNLRRNYGMCFVIECQRRSLSRILVEMAIDFIMKANVTSKEDAILRKDVIEATLLHLNEISFNMFEDLLAYNLGGGIVLCDVFMQAIAITQNFSQFKPVFINLTNFIVRIGRTFNCEVAALILERLCILPFEEHSIQAMIKIIKNTSASIFKNAMMAQFEKLLASSKSNCHEELLSIKNAVNTNQSESTNLYEAPLLIHQDFNQIKPNTMMYMEREKRYTSPDTTNLDNLQNNTPDEPKITRTVDFNRMHSFSVTMHSNHSSHSSNSSEIDDCQPRNKFNRHWRFPERQMLNSGRGWFNPRPGRGMIRPLWSMNRIHGDVRHVAYGPRPVRHIRQGDPNFT